MKITRSLSMPIHPTRLARAALAFAFALVLVACGGGGVVTVDPPKNAVSTVGPRTLDPEFFVRKAVAYSPFRSADRDKEIAALVDPVKSAAMNANIKQDLNLLVAAKFGLIRIFDSYDGPVDPATGLAVEGIASRVLRIIREDKLDIKVQLGAYVNSFQYVPNAQLVAYIKAENEKELQRAAKLANAYKEIVLAVSVGNETMVVWSIVPIDPAVMAGYIRTVRGQIEQPITTDDNWAFFAHDAAQNRDPKLIVEAIDFVSMHSYAEIDTQFADIAWDWKQKNVPRAARAAAMMDAAMVATRKQYQAVRDYLDRNGLGAMPITIGESGWNAENAGKLKFRANPVNQKMYYDRLMAWALESRTAPGPKAIFYFEAFDEPWKQSDDLWGLFNVKREARYVVQGLKPAGSATWVNEAVAAAKDVNGDGKYTEADALSWYPPVVNTALDTATYDRYTLFADATSPTEFRSPLIGDAKLAWNAWEGTADGNHVFKGTPSADGPNSFEISPNPYAGWGWGMFLGSGDEPFVSPDDSVAKVSYTTNLSGFAATGRLNFSVRTTYPGKIEVGILTNTAENETAEAYIALSDGDQYGYCNTNAWCKVSIPLADLLKGNAGDLSMLMHRFVIADRFDRTGKDSGTKDLPKVYIDAIYFSK